MQLESTTKIVEVEIAGQRVPARIWEGRTAKGTPVHCYVTRVAVQEGHDAGELERELVGARQALGGRAGDPRALGVAVNIPADYVRTVQMTAEVEETKRRRLADFPTANMLFAALELEGLGARVVPMAEISGLLGEFAVFPVGAGGAA